MDPAKLRQTAQHAVEGSKRKMCQPQRVVAPGCRAPPRSYWQHNPLNAHGLEGLKAFLGFLAQTFPDMRVEIKRVFAEGD